MYSMIMQLFISHYSSTRKRGKRKASCLLCLLLYLWWLNWNLGISRHRAGVCAMFGLLTTTAPWLLISSRLFRWEVFIKYLLIFRLSAR